MFYSQFILAKKGPLGTIWIAAHLERKLRKNQVADTDIGTSVDSILSSDVPIALRLSSHLLLGVVKIYSRKVNYLFDDCSEALLKVKHAFRSAIVDLPPEEAKAPYLSITLPETFDLDDFELPESALFQGNYVDHHVSAREHITLQDTMEGIVYSTTKFGLDERFGDGDATQYGLDLEDILVEENATKESDKRVPGVDSDGLASVRPATPVKINEINKGMSHTSDAITDNPDRNQGFSEATHSMESVKLPYTSQIEKPKLLNSREKLHSDHAPVTENHDLMGRSRVAETDPNEFNNPDLQQRHGSGNCSIHAEIVSGTTACDFGRSAYHDSENTSQPHITTIGKLLDDSSLSGPSKQQKPGSVEFESACSGGRDDLHVVVSVTNYSSACASGHVLVNGQMLGIRLGGNVPISDTYNSKPGSTLETINQKFSQESACHKVSGGELGTKQASVMHAERFCIDSLSDQFAACTIQSSHISEKEIPQMQGGRHLPTLYNDGLVGVPGVNSGMQGASNAPIGTSKIVPTDSNNEVLKDNRVVNADKCPSSVLPGAMNLLPGQTSAGNYNEFGDHNDSIPKDTRLKFFDKSIVPDFAEPESLLSVPERANYTPNTFITECRSNNELQTERPNSPQHMPGKMVSGKKRSLTESTLTTRSHISDESFGLAKCRVTANSIPDEVDLLSSILVGRESSVVKVRSTPLSDAAPVKRLRIETRVSSKRKALLDDSVILHADTIRKQLLSTEDIRRVRRKAPCTCSEIWMLQKLSVEDEVFIKPLSSGISGELTVLHGGLYSSGRVENNSSIDCVNVAENVVNPNNSRKTICALNLEDYPVDAVVTSSDGEFVMVNKASEKDFSLHVNSNGMPDCKLNHIATGSTIMVGTNGSKSNFTETTEHLEEIQKDQTQEISNGDFLGSVRENNKTVDGKCIPADFVSTCELFGEMTGNEATEINHGKCAGLVSRNDRLGEMRGGNKKAEDRQVTCIDFVPINGFIREMGERSKAIEARQVTGTEFMPRTGAIEEMRENHEVTDVIKGAHRAFSSNIENLDMNDSNQAVEAGQSANTESVPRKFLEISVSNQETKARERTNAEFMPTCEFFRDASENNKAADGRHSNHAEFVPSGGEYLVMRQSNKAAEARQSADAEICPGNEVMGTSVSNQEAEVRLGIYAEFMPRSEFFKEVSEHIKTADDKDCNHMGIIPSGGESLAMSRSNQAAEARQGTSITDFVPNSGVFLEMREHNQVADAKLSTCTGFVPINPNLTEINDSNKTREVRHAIHQDLVSCSGAMVESRETNQAAKGAKGIYTDLVSSSKVLVEMRLCTLAAESRPVAYKEFVASSEVSGEMRESNQASEDRQASTESSSFHGDSFHLSKNISKEPTNLCNQVEADRQGTHKKSHLLVGTSNHFSETVHKNPACLCNLESIKKDVPNYSTGESMVLGDSSVHLSKNISREPTYLCNQAETDRQSSHREPHFLVGASNHLLETVHEKPACLCNQESIKNDVSNNATEDSAVLGDSSFHYSKNKEPTYLCNQAETDRHGTQRESHLLLGVSSHHSETIQQIPAYLYNQESIKTDVSNYVADDSAFLTTGALAVANAGSYDGLNFGSPSTHDKRLEILFSLGHEDNVKEMTSNIELSQSCKEPDAVLAGETVDSEHRGRGFCDSKKTAFGNDTEFLQMDCVGDLRMNGNDVPLLEDDDLLENSGWSARTRAVAKYLQTRFTKDDDCERKVVAMERLLSGRTCKEASRMFFETLVLKTRDYIDVSQEKPFESICITPQPKLMKTNFEE